MIDEQRATTAPAGRSDPWAGWSEAQILLLGAAIIDVVRDLSRELPAPRGTPCFGLEYVGGDMGPLDHFSSRGIFRKYETVLELGSGLGAEARWWSARFGCHVVGVESKPALTRVASELSARAGAGPASRFLCADAGGLPCRQRYFTHVWSAGGLSRIAAGDPRLAEALRVLRPGGHAAFQLLDPPRAETDAAVAALREAGFTEIEVQMVQRPSLSETMRLARDRLLRRLECDRDPLATSVVAGLATLYRSSASRGDRIAHISARRPVM